MPASAFVQLGGATRSGRWFGWSRGALAAHGGGASSSTSRTKSVALATGQTAAAVRGAAPRQLCACACACARACGAAKSAGPGKVQPHPDGRAVRASAAQRRPPQHWRV
eukprot:scaffold109065_cov75-Phaeocystis_antarctica.AAC.2